MNSVNPFNELRQLIDTANAPIFGVDADGNVNEWNGKTAEITGYRKEEAMNKPFVKTVFPRNQNLVFLELSATHSWKD